jgi:quinol-cytochrome oxidoreductase complex cytochrome b subunit
LVLLHVIFLHDKGSSNPLGVLLSKDKVMFNPYYTIKDIYSIVCVLMVFVLFCMFYPNYLGHTDNYIEANPLVTPSHIVPE